MFWHYNSKGNLVNSLLWTGPQFSHMNFQLQIPRTSLFIIKFLWLCYYTFAEASAIKPEINLASYPRWHLSFSSNLQICKICTWRRKKIEDNICSRNFVLLLGYKRPWWRNKSRYLDVTNAMYALMLQDLTWTTWILHHDTLVSWWGCQMELVLWLVWSAQL